MQKILPAGCGLSAVLSEGHQVVVHGIHEQFLTHRVVPHKVHRLHPLHQLRGRDEGEAQALHQVGSVVHPGLPVVLQPQHGHLKERQLWLHGRRQGVQHGAHLLKVQEEHVLHQVLVGELLGLVQPVQSCDLADLFVVLHRDLVVEELHAEFGDLRDVEDLADGEHLLHRVQGEGHISRVEVLQHQPQTDGGAALQHQVVDGGVRAGQELVIGGGGRGAAAPLVLRREPIFSAQHVCGEQGPEVLWAGCQHRFVAVELLSLRRESHIAEELLPPQQIETVQQSVAVSRGQTWRFGHPIWTWLLGCAHLLRVNNAIGALHCMEMHQPVL